jgi:DNA-directed RNA polymerase omega subunit
MFREGGRMVDIPLEDLIKKTNSLFKLVNLASKRALQLNEGAQPLIEEDNPQAKFATIALQEILAGKIVFKQ